MSTVYETTVDTLREVGERLAHDVPSSLASVRVPSVRIPSGVSDVLSDWPVVVDRVTGRRRTRWQTPVFVGAGVVAAIVAIVWFVRRRRTAEVEQRLSVASNEARAAGAA